MRSYLIVLFSYRLVACYMSPRSHVRLRAGSSRLGNQRRLACLGHECASD
jgi:hypothetical protein